VRRRTVLPPTKRNAILYLSSTRKVQIPLSLGAIFSVLRDGWSGLFEKIFCCFSAFRCNCFGSARKRSSNSSDDNSSRHALKKFRVKHAERRRHALQLVRVHFHDKLLPSPRNLWFYGKREVHANTVSYFSVPRNTDISTFPPDILKHNPKGGFIE